MVDLENTSPSLLIWRSMLQWLGGIGIIVIAIAVFPVLKVGGMQLFKTEFSSRDDKVLPRTKTIAAGIGLVYFGLTFVCFLSLVIAGMNIFDAVAHSMTIVATGGFSTKNMSIGHFDSILIESVSIFFMFISALPFIILFQLLKGKFLIFFRNSQIQFFFIVVFFLTLLTYLFV